MVLKFVHRYFFIISMIVVDGIHSKVSLEEQLEHVVKTRRESKGHDNNLNTEPIPSRRQMESGQPHQYRREFMLDLDNAREIMGIPSRPSHLPEAEPILPGHTLLRPAMGMLKSSINFPHRELENGAGVLGNYDNLGLKWDGRNERVLYTGFRRNAPNTRRSSWTDSPRSDRRMLADYIMVVPSAGNAKPRLSLTNLVLDMNKEKEASTKVLKRLKTIKQPIKKSKSLIMYVANPTGAPLFLKDLFQETNSDPAQDDIDEWLVASLFDSRRDENIVEVESKEKTEAKEAGKSKEIVKLKVEEDNTLSRETVFHTKKESKENRNETKLEKFYATKNLFNTIKIHPDLINFEDLVPELKSPEDNKKRPWWFYNQIDQKEFSSMEA